MIKLDLVFKNLTSEPISELRYTLTGGNGLPIEGRWYASYFRAAVAAMTPKKSSAYLVEHQAADIANAALAEEGRDVVVPEAGAGAERHDLFESEVAEIYPDVVVYNDAGQPETVQYRKVNAMLLNEVQRQHRQLKVVLTRLAAVERRLDTKGVPRLKPANAP